MFTSARPRALLPASITELRALCGDPARSRRDVHAAREPAEPPPPPALCAMVNAAFLRYCQDAASVRPAFEFPALPALAELAEVFTGFARGLAPSLKSLERMLQRDLIFAARLPKLVAAVHTRILRAGDSLGASDVIERDGVPRPELFPPPRAWTDCVLCHHAVTHPAFQHRDLHLGRRLITEQVLPQLGADARTRGLPWYTCSPLTALMATGRALSAAPVFAAVLARCDQMLDRALAGPLGSLRALIDAAWPFLMEQDFPLPAEARRAPRTFFTALYHGLWTHQEALDAGPRAAAVVERLHHAQPPPSDPQRLSQRAAFALCYLAATFTQGAYDGETGQPLDPVLRFHLGNGGELHPSLGPLPSSRRTDTAALRFGQLVVYSPRFRESQRQHKALLRARQRRHQRGAQLDLGAFSGYLWRVAERLPGVLNPAPAR